MKTTPRNNYKTWYSENKEKISTQNKEQYMITDGLTAKKKQQIAMLRNSKILHELKINGCAICGYNKCDACLEFHHVNPRDKKFYLIVNNISLKDKRIINEINKCILLCNRCHREIHMKNKEMK